MLRGSRLSPGFFGTQKTSADTAGGYDDGVGREGAHFHALQIHGGDAAAHPVGIEHGGEELPVLELLDFALGLVAADLFVERIE